MGEGMCVCVVSSYGDELCRQSTGRAKQMGRRDAGGRGGNTLHCGGRPEYLRTAIKDEGI